MARKRGLGKGLDALLHSMNMPETSAKQVMNPDEQAQEGQVVEQDLELLEIEAVGSDISDGDAGNDTGDAIVAASSTQDAEGEGSVSDDASDASKIKYIPVEFLKRGQYQPRNDIDPESLEELASSIRLRGVIQPLVVRPLDSSGSNYEIVAGERRWRASQLAGLDKVPCVVKVMADEAALAIALIENIQREDLNPIEEAKALYRLQEEFQLTHQQIADAVGKSRTTITNVLRLNALNDEIKRLVEHGDIEVGHAKALLVLSKAKQIELANLIVAKGLSVRQTEAAVRQMHSAKNKKTSTPDEVDPNVKRLQQDLSERLGAKVLINHTAKGSGKLVVTFNSLDELDGILEHIQ